MIAVHTTDAEQAVLGSVLVDNKAMVAAAKVVDQYDFIHHSNAIIWNAMAQMYDDQVAIDMLTLTSALDSQGMLTRAGGRERVIELLESVPTAANVEHYAQVVREHSIKRKLGEAGAAIQRFAGNGDATKAVELAQRELGHVAKRAAPSKVIRIGEAMEEAFGHVQKVHEAGSRVTGVGTGFAQLDKLLAGFHQRELVIVAGRPSMGKTALATSFAVTAARNGHHTLIFSLEMSARQLAMRILSTESMVGLQDMRTANCHPDDWSSLARTTNECGGLPMTMIDESDLTIAQLRTIAREQNAQNKIRLVLVDYLQLVRAPGAERREREIAIISAGLKALAKELDVTVIALSQLNRNLESRPDKRPHLGDLRESGGLEQDADVVMFVYRDEKYNPKSDHKGTAELIVSKQRQGPTGTARVGFIDSRAQFVELSGGSSSPGRV